MRRKPRGFRRFGSRAFFGTVPKDRLFRNERTLPAHHARAGKTDRVRKYPSSQPVVSPQTCATDPAKIRTLGTSTQTDYVPIPDAMGSRGLVGASRLTRPSARPFAGGSRRRLGRQRPARRSVRTADDPGRYAAENNRQPGSLPIRKRARLVGPPPHRLPRLSRHDPKRKHDSRNEPDRYCFSRRDSDQPGRDRRAGTAPADERTRRHDRLPCGERPRAARRRGASDRPGPARHGAQGRRSPLHGQNDRADLRRRPSAVRRERPLGPRLSGGQRRGRHSGLRRTTRGGAAQGQQERQETHGNEPRYAQQAREKRQRRGAGRLRSRHRPGPRRTPQGTLRSRRFVQLFLGTAHLLGRGEQQQQQSVVQPHPRPVRLIRGRRRRRPPQHDARRQPDAPLRQASDPVGKLPLRQRAVGNAADHATDLFPVGSLPVAQLHRHDPSLAPRQATLGQSRSAL